MWKDKWLSSSSSYRLVTFPHFFPNNAMVFALIIPEIASWKSDLVHEIFLTFDAEAILSIPLSPSQLADKLI